MKLNIHDVVFGFIAISIWTSFMVSSQDGCHHGDENLYCYPAKPNIFYRCVKGRLYTFKCPHYLKFNMISDSCDWVGKCIEHDQKKFKKHESGHVPQKKRESSPNHQQPKSHVPPSHHRQEKPYVRPSKYHHQKPYASSSNLHQPKSKTHRNYFMRGSDNIPKSSSHVSSILPSCDPSSCLLPSCHCPSTSIPKGLAAANTPQMVMITFDDEITPENYKIYQRIFRAGRYNPNGCPMRGAFFVSGQGTKYEYIYPLYAIGNEINVHTVSHRYPQDWWSSASYNDFNWEIGGMLDKLTKLGIHKDHIKGFRIPFLQVGGDGQYKVLKEKGFFYDSSMYTEDAWSKDKTPIWPFTLDHPPNAFLCHSGSCPKKSYPGLWEVPLQRWKGVDGKLCIMADECKAGQGEETLNYFRENFSRYYNSNRAPFGIFIHFRWLRSKNNLEALDAFIDELLDKHDVWIITPLQVIRWIQQPVSSSKAKSFQPWHCDDEKRAVSLGDI